MINPTASNEMTSPIDALAYCGLYCPACSFKVAYEEQDRTHLRAMPAEYDRFKEEPLNSCEGCRKGQASSCEISNCAQERGLLHCGCCPDFPCERITQFATDGVPHHAEALVNLQRIRQIGETDWLAEQEARYRCSCGNRLSWYVPENMLPQAVLCCNEKGPGKSDPPTGNNR